MKLSRLVFCFCPVFKAQFRSALQSVGGHQIFLYCFLIYSFVTINGFGQPPDLAFEKYSISNGLSDNNTTTILQDSRGFIWIGSSYGLNRFDGRHFKKYAVFGEQGLTDITIQCLAEDKEGNIWIGTQNGLNRLDPHTEKIKQYYMGKGPGTIPYKWCNFLYLDKSSNLWLSTERGLALYIKGTDSFINYPVTVYGKDPGINKFISKIFEDSRGRFWLTTSYGIKLFDRKTRQFRSYFYFDKSEMNTRLFPVMSIAEDAYGNIWAGTWMGGLLRYDEGSNAFSIVSNQDVNFKNLVISDLCPIKFGGADYLLSATDHGLYVLNTKGRLHWKLTEPFDDLQKLCIDRQGNLWVAGTMGLYKLNKNSLAFRWMYLPGEKGKTLVFHIIPHCKDPENTFLLSTLNGWWKYDDNNKLISPFVLPADPALLLTRINSWCTAGRGYWFTSMNGFGFYDLLKNQLTDLSQVTSLNSNSKSTGFIVCDQYQKLWLSVYRSGMLVFDPVKNVKHVLFGDKNKPDNLTGKSVKDIVTAPDGRVYFTAGGKLFVLSARDFSYKSIPPPNNNSRVDASKVSPDKLFFTPGNRLFVSSALQIYEYAGGNLKKVFPAKGYPDFSIEKMYCSKAGVVWVISSKGVLKTDTAFRQWININDRLGWSEDEHISEIYTGKSGEVLFAANGKIGVLRDSALLKSSVLNPVVISRVVHGSTEVFMVPQVVSDITTSYKEPVEIELATVNYCNEKEVRILYQLQGWDAGWRELSGQSSVRFEQLPPGKYIFNARQVNVEGIQGAVTSFGITIKPPFYFTWWFILLVVAAFIGAYSAFNRYRMQKALEIERLRTRIATDLHDDIGATLSAISFYSEALKMQLHDRQPQATQILTKIGDSSRQMVTGMSDIVWAINPDNDHAAKLVERIQNYATDICPVRNILLHFDVDSNINDIKLPLEHRKNIYLIFKEALNNSVKYAGSANIWIDLQTDGKTISLSVRDDGAGFTESAAHKGNGFKNMRSRAALLNAALQIQSSPGNGTTISLSWDK